MPTTVKWYPGDLAGECNSQSQTGKRVKRIRCDSSTKVWPLRLDGYHHPISTKSSQLLVRLEGGEALEDNLLEALQSVGVIAIVCDRPFILQGVVMMSSCKR